MKKLFSLTAAVIFLVFGVKSSFGQSGCVSCNNNVIDTLKFSSAIGTDNTATGNRSFAGGSNSQATGDYSFAFGEGALSTGINSFALGKEAKAGLVNSVAIGFQSEATQPFAFAIGYRNHAHAMASFLFGNDLKTVHSGAMIIGRGTNEFLINDKNNSLMIGFNSNLPTLFVGPSEGTGTTGRIGIGNVTDPQAKLHIRADENEHATLRLEATGSDKHSRLYFSDDIYLTASPQNNLSFTLPENNNLILENGNVGIGTSQPQAKLHVHGDFQVGDTANPQNMRLYGSINATGVRATALGTNTTASGHSAFASGNLAIAQGNFSTAIGGNVTASADNSITVGRFLQTGGGQSIVIGSGKNNTVRLSNGFSNTLMIGFSSDKSTLFVSETPSGFESGSIGIGNVTEPQAKLHIRADANEHATLRLEATGSDKHARINFTDAHQILTSANDDMHFHTAEGKGYIFHGGDIFLSDIQSGIIMKSPNGQCWRGVMSDNGQLVFSATDCPDGAVSVPKPTVEPALQMKIYPNPTDGTITIEVPDSVTNAGWSLRSTDGALLMRNRITSGKTEVSLAHFVPGVYVITIEQNGRLIASEKLVKQ